MLGAWQGGPPHLGVLHILALLMESCSMLLQEELRLALKFCCHESGQRHLLSSVKRFSGRA